MTPVLFTVSFVADCENEEDAMNLLVEVEKANRLGYEAVLERHNLDETEMVLLSDMFRWYGCSFQFPQDLSNTDPR